MQKIGANVGEFPMADIIEVLNKAQLKETCMGVAVRAFPRVVYLDEINDLPKSLLIELMRAKASAGEF